VLLINFGRRPFRVKRGDRIAQLIIAPVYQAALELADELDETPRSGGGFGHTGG
jgi:dUTP pyrophosphatase